jgi:guanylate kinase
MQRQTESEEVIIKRLQKAAEETESVDYYEYFVINDEIDKCAENINKIAAEAEPELPSMEQVQKIKEDILKFSKGE